MLVRRFARTLKTLLNELFQMGFYSVDKHGCAGSFSTRREQAVWGSRCPLLQRDLSISHRSYLSLAFTPAWCSLTAQKAHRKACAGHCITTWYSHFTSLGFLMGICHLNTPHEIECFVDFSPLALRHLYCDVNTINYCEISIQTEYLWSLCKIKLTTLKWPSNKMWNWRICYHIILKCILYYSLLRK